jgi:thymidylate synthase (FAD)
MEPGWATEALESLDYIGKRQVHEHGHVILEDMMGNELSIVNSARLSFNQSSAELSSKDQGLINFLMRERHSTPFESIEFQFDVKAPLFVVREWQRHRLSSFNEWSARYSEIDEEFYVPERSHVREQHGKPGAYTFEPMQDPEVVDDAIYHIERCQKEAFRTYHYLMEKGVAKEVARTVLPVGMYSRMKYKANLRSVLNFLSLRNHPHAQLEIQEFAVALEALVTEQLPYVMECWNTHGRNPI